MPASADTSPIRRAREASGSTGLETRIDLATGVPSHTNRNKPRQKPLSDSCDDLYIVSHNLRGAKGSYDPGGNSRDLNKLEVLARLMTENNIDIYLLQETWLLDDWIITIKGVTVIHHGPKEPASNRGSGGVAIMLGPRAQRAWRAAGSPDPYCPGNIVDNTTRYMGIDLLFHPRKNQPAKFFVACVYAPYSEMENTHPGIITRFYEKIEQHLLQLPHDMSPIVGGDFNASIGVRGNAGDDSIIGPYGLPHSNSAGEKLIDFARNCSLQASATYFKQRSYETFYDLRNNRAPRQLDLIFVHQRHGPHVTNAGVYQPRNNVISDHPPTRLKLRLVRHLSKSKRQQRQQPQESTNGELLVEDPINWALLRNPPHHIAYQNVIDTILQEYADCETHEATPTQISNAIMYAAECTITEEKKPIPNWFDASEPIVRPLRDAAQRAYKAFLADGSEEKKHHWQASRRQYYRVQRQSKKKFFDSLAVNACQHAMCSDPKGAWEAVRMLEQGSTAHHRPPRDLQFRDPVTKKVATTPAANLEILRAHCHKVYNRDDAPVDPTVLDDISHGKPYTALADPNHQ